MRFLIKKMNRIDAEIISKWTYQEPYSIYNMDGSEECMSELLDGSYYSAFDEEDNLIGYFCFGKSAQVPAGNQFRAYDDNAYTDIGLGIRPDLCGKGLGFSFLEKGIRFAYSELSAVKIRLTVAGFNQRAIKVYERAGFIRATAFNRVTGKGEMEFLVMTSC